MNRVIKREDLVKIDDFLIAEIINNKLRENCQ